MCSPVVNHERAARRAVFPKQLLVHRNDRGLGPLACQEQGFQRPEAPLLAYPLQVVVMRIISLDGTESSYIDGVERRKENGH